MDNRNDSITGIPKHHVSTLETLAAADLEAVQAYEWALPNIDTPELADKVKGFSIVHENHARELGRAIEANGGTAPLGDDDHESSINEHLTSLGDSLYTLAAFERICMQERLTIERYEAALGGHIPDSVRGMLEAHLLEIREHHRFIEQALISVKAAAKLWGPPDQPWILNH